MSSSTDLLDRISRASVEQRTDAYADVAWDAAGAVLDPADPRWTLPPGIEPLADTAWYQALSPERQARIGLERANGMLKVGWQFENLLQRGLLERSLWLSDDDPSLRYLQHEVAEESQHTLMFQELIRRSPVPADGVPTVFLTVTERIILRFSRRFPELFFVFVMGGEDPADMLQRRLLRSDAGHPLFREIIRIHVAEEARHLTFARSFLTTNAPLLGRRRRFVLSLLWPMIVGEMARIMMHLSPDLVARNEIPKDVLVEAYAGEAGMQVLRDAAAKPRELALKLGLVNPVAKRLWKRFGIWQEPA